MKNAVTTLIILGIPLFLAPAARADYAFSITYGSPSVPKAHNACTHNPGLGITCGPSRRTIRFPHPWGHTRRYRDTTRVVYVTTGPREQTVVRKVPADNREKLGISDIIILSKAGVRDDIIIEKIQRTGSVFDLSVEEIEALRKETVSSRVINYMLDTSR